MKMREHSCHFGRVHCSSERFGSLVWKLPICIKTGELLRVPSCGI